MKKLSGSFWDEIHSLRKNGIALCLLGVLFVVLMLIIHNGITDRKENLARAKRFQVEEARRLTTFKTMRQYASTGFRIMGFPDIQFIFFSNTGGSPDIYSNINSSGALKYDKPLDGGIVLKSSRLFSIDFAHLLLLFGSMFCLYYGWEMMRNIDYIKILLNKSSPGKVLTIMILSRMIIIELILAFIMGSAIVLTVIEGVPFTFGPILFYLWGLLSLGFFFFFCLGCAAGTIKNKAISLTATFSAWIVFILVIPIAFHIILSSQAKSMKEYEQYENEKEKLVIMYENRIEQNIGKLKKGEKVSGVFRDAVKSFMRNEFKMILKTEETQVIEIKKAIAKRDKLAILSPTLFVTELFQVMSGSGYKNEVEFINYSYRLKKEFMDFFVKTFYFKLDNPDFEKVVGFIKGNENVYCMKGKIGDNAFTGFGITLFYCFILLAFIHSRLKKRLFDIPDWNNDDPQVIDFQKGAGYLVYGDQNTLFTLYSGKMEILNKKKFNDRFTVDGEAAQDFSSGKGVYFICHPDSLLGFCSLKHSIRFVGRMWCVDESRIDSIINEFNRRLSDRKKRKDPGRYEKGLIVLAMLRMIEKDSVAILDNPQSEMLPDFPSEMKREIEALKQRNVAVLYLTPGNMHTDNWKNPKETHITVISLDGFLREIDLHRKYLKE